MERVTMFKDCYFGEVFKTSKECEEFESYVRNIGILLVECGIHYCPDSERLLPGEKFYVLQCGKHFDWYEDPVFGYFSQEKLTLRGSRFLLKEEDRGCTESNIYSRYNVYPVSIETMLQDSNRAILGVLTPMGSVDMPKTYCVSNVGSLIREVFEESRR